MPTPRSQEENQCAADACGDLWFTWVGYRGGSTEESLVDADGCPITYRKWRAAESEPHLNTDDNCLEIDSLGRWFDDPCHYNRYWLCQLQDCHRPECP